MPRVAAQPAFANAIHAPAYGIKTERMRPGAASWLSAGPGSGGGYRPIEVGARKNALDGCCQRNTTAPPAISQLMEVSTSVTLLPE